MALRVGRVCVKIFGRETGKKCVIVDRVDKNFVLIAGPNVRRRRCNVSHLDPTETMLDIKKNVTDAALKTALKKAKVSLEE